MEERIQVLDHGYLAKVEHYGSDESIIEAARMSTAKGFLGWGPAESAHSCQRGGTSNNSSDMCAACHQGPGDEKLLKYLYENKHATPFEFAGLIIEVKAPIMVFREWHRHRTQSYNEMSARYTPLPDENYIPTVDRIMMDGGKNKQAQGVGMKISKEYAENFQKRLSTNYAKDEELYQEALRGGVPKELARLVIPVGRYSKMRANANLRNWLSFLTLRMDRKAQWEIRQYANEVGKIISKSFPRTWELFELGRRS